MNPEAALVLYYRDYIQELVDEALEHGIVVRVGTTVNPKTASIKKVEVDTYRTVRTVEA